MTPNATVRWPDKSEERVQIESLAGDHYWVSRQYRDERGEEVARVPVEWVTRDAQKARKKG